MAKRIRKAADELTIADLERFPAWEFCLDEESLPGQDEATMRPVVGRRLVSTSSLYGWVVTDFVAAGGKRMIGVLGPDDTLWGMSPQIFLPQKPRKIVSHKALDEWNQVMTADKARIGLAVANPRAALTKKLRPVIKLVYKVLGLTRAELFPLEARPRVAIKGWPKSIVIKGFLRPPDDSGRCAVVRA